ncbi:MAG: hypothetical protein RLZZ478_133, partial [Actinomycetota bacterium]
VKSDTAVSVKIVKVTRPRNSEVKVISVNPATSARGDMTKWIMPRSLGLLITFIERLHRFIKGK